MKETESRILVMQLLNKTSSALECKSYVRLREKGSHRVAEVLRGYLLL